MVEKRKEMLPAPLLVQSSVEQTHSAASTSTGMNRNEPALLSILKDYVCNHKLPCIVALRNVSALCCWEGLDTAHSLDVYVLLGAAPRIIGEVVTTFAFPASRANNNNYWSGRLSARGVDSRDALSIDAPSNQYIILG